MSVHGASTIDGWCMGNPCACCGYAGYLPYDVSGEATMLRMLLGLVALSAVFASAALAQQPPGPPFVITVPSNEFRFVGFSSNSVLGNVGWDGMADTCQQDFPGSRICTSGEYFLSPTMTPNGSAWAQPDPPGQALPGANTASSCGGWSNSNLNGTVITDFDGRTVPLARAGAEEADCATARRVTCCAPIQ